MAFGIKINPADTYFSLCIRERAGWTCERCSGQYQRGDRGLECAHYYGRKYWGLRFDPDNAFCLCTGCHAFFHASPEDFRGFYLSTRREKLAGIIKRSNNIILGQKFHTTHGKGKISAHYRDQYTHMLSLRAKGDNTYLDFEIYTP